MGVAVKLEELTQPSEVTDIDLAFPARGIELMPDLDIIPDEFQGNEWNRFAEDWFMFGWPEQGLFPKEGVDPEKAVAHARVVLGCYGIKHEHKIAGVGFLLSLWFDSIGPKSTATEKDE